MKISNSKPPQSIQVGTQPEVAGLKAPATGTSGNNVSSSTVSHLNKALTDPTHDINSSRVDEVKQAIIDGKLEIDARKIADGLLDNMKGL